MKTFKQIERYLSQCRFSPEDWEKIKMYCYQYENGGFVKKPKKPVIDCTYSEFVNWVDNGFGAGDCVSYGNTVGLVSDFRPGKIVLGAYYGIDDNFIIKDMLVLEPERLRHADEHQIFRVNRSMYEAGKYFNIETGKITSICTPKENLYYSLLNGAESGGAVGIYCETKHNKYHFYILLIGGKVYKDYWIDINYTPLIPASEKEIRRLHKAMSKANMVYDVRRKGFVGKSVYWYLNDKFEIVADKDNGDKRHKERYEAGNYFVNLAEATLFMRAVIELIKGK